MWSQDKYNNNGTETCMLELYTGKIVLWCGVYVCMRALHTEATEQPWMLSTSFETGSSIGLNAHQLDSTDWLENPKDPPVSISLALRL